MQRVRIEVRAVETLASVSVHRCSVSYSTTMRTEGSHLPPLLRARDTPFSSRVLVLAPFSRLAVEEWRKIGKWIVVAMEFLKGEAVWGGLKGIIIWGGFEGSLVGIILIFLLY